MNFNRRSFGALIAGATVMPFVGSRRAAAQTTIRLTMASSHPTVLPWVGPLQTIVTRSNEVLEERGSEYRLDWTEAYNGQLYGLTETLEAVEQNITDMGWIGALFEPSKLALQNIMYATPFVTNDVRQAIETMNPLNFNEQAMIDEWSKHDVVFLGCCCSDGYSLFTKEPLDDIEDLAGRRMLGVPVTAPWLEAVGATPVPTGLPEMYSGLQTGVGEGVIMIGTGAYPLRLHEVAPYATRVDTGPFTFGGVGINKPVFEGLPEEVQQVLIELGRAYSEENAQLIEQRAEAAWPNFEKEGATVRVMPMEEKMRWVNAMPDLGKIWVEENESAGVPAREIMKSFMAQLREVGGEPMRDWSANI